MIFTRFGRDTADLGARLAARPIPEFLQRNTLAGTGEQIKARIAALADVGVQQVILNWMDDYNDTAGITALARAVL